MVPPNYSILNRYFTLFSPTLKDWRLLDSTVAVGDAIILVFRTYNILVRSEDDRTTNLASEFLMIVLINFTSSKTGSVIILLSPS